MSENTVTITQEEYDELHKAQEFLRCLQMCGVDDWDGYGDAQELFESGIE